MLAATTAALCFGKLPAHGDFIRHRAGKANGGRGVQEFDSWLQRGMHHARQSLGARFQDVFDTAPGLSFIIDLPTSSDVLVGAIRPSRDSAGRRYPFLLAASVPRGQVDGRRLPSWPLRYQAFFEEANALTTDLVEGRLTTDHIPNRLVDLGTLFDQSHFVVDYEYKMRQALVWPLWGRTWGTAEDGRKYVLLKNLAEVFATARGHPVRLPLRFPFPPVPGEMDGSFWLEICWRFNERPPAETALFWPESSIQGGLHVALANPPPALFTHLFSPRGQGDGCLYLDDPEGRPTADAALALPEEYSAILENEMLSFRAFIDNL